MNSSSHSLGLEAVTAYFIISPLVKGKKPGREDTTNFNWF